MKYVFRTVVGLGLLVAAIVGISYGVFQMLQIGTCASGGPYEIARECPDGALGVGLAIPAGIFLMLFAAGLYAVRGAAPGSEKRGDPSLALLYIWSGLFLGIGFACFWGVWGPDANPGPGGKEGGLIVGFLFVPMGLIPLLGFVGVRGRKEKLQARLEKARLTGSLSSGGGSFGMGGRGAEKPAPDTSVVLGDGDRLTRLERLQRLRDQGTIDAAEFQRLKDEVMGS